MKYIFIYLYIITHTMGDAKKLYDNHIPADKELLYRLIGCIIGEPSYEPCDISIYTLYALKDMMEKNSIKRSPLKGDRFTELERYILLTTPDKFQIDTPSYGYNEGRFYLYYIHNGKIHYQQMTDNVYDDIETISVSEPICATLTYMTNLFKTDKGAFYTLTCEYKDEMKTLFME